MRIPGAFASILRCGLSSKLGGRIRGVAPGPPRPWIRGEGLRGRALRLLVRRGGKRRVVVRLEPRGGGSAGE